ncbi:MAG TPA: ATP-binding protein [Kofleriaceae bacterium]|nr:ATP-binding protein [Kofleriaceae bacterium]
MIRLIERWAEVLNRRTVVAVALALTLAIGAGDVATRVEAPLTILYLLPIGLGTWFRDRRFGTLLSWLATACIVASLVRDYTTLLVVWNTGGSLLLFLVVTWLVDHLHAYVVREQAERRLAVDQLRHGERLRIIGTLAAGVAHEIGTPLNVIAGCAELVAEQDRGAVMQRRAQMILDQTKKISRIIRQLLDFGHQGGLTARTRVDMNAVVTSVAAMLESTARTDQRRIVLELGPPVVVSGSAAELEQVVSNLVLNGLQAMRHPGTVRVRTSVESRPGARGAPRRVACVAIEDEGAGIATEHIGRIFDPFFTTKGVGEGTGLGLSVSYGIARDHGGSIEVDSQPRRGSRFTVVLPLCE